MREVVTMILIIPIWVAMMILVLVGAYRCYRRNTEDDDYED